ncbi:MAG: carboxymuconolactone decarboxylase family protein [Pseudomonadota bacterium]
MSDFIIYDPQSAPEKEARSLLGKTAERFGCIPNLLGSLAESPPALEAYFALESLFDKSCLSKVEKHVLLLTISRFHECSYCVSVHTAEGEHEDIPKAITTAIREDTPLTDSRLESLRTFTQVVLANRGHITEQELNDFLKAGFNKREVLEVVLAVSYKVLSNFTNIIIKTPLDDHLDQYAWEQ